MKVYRLCGFEEIDKILKCKNFSQVGSNFVIDDKKSTHRYDTSKKFLHFAEHRIDLLFHYLKKNKFICTYEIPDEILSEHFGYGKYLDYVKFKTLENIREYAIPTDLLKFEFLTEVDKIVQPIDYEEVWDNPSMKGFLEKFYEKKPATQKQDLVMNK